MKFRFYLIAATTLLLSALSPVHAETAPAKPAGSVKKVMFKKSKAAKPAAPAMTADEAEPDMAESTATELNCELGRKLTVYRKSGDDSHIMVRWKEKLLRFLRVDTQTGAHRFENEKHGLVWIGIPTKSMLLDSKNGRQLANECRSAEQAQELLKAKG